MHCGIRRRETRGRGSAVRSDAIERGEREGETNLRSLVSSGVQDKSNNETVETQNLGELKIQDIDTEGGRRGRGENVGGQLTRSKHRVSNLGRRENATSEEEGLLTMRIRIIPTNNLGC